MFKIKILSILFVFSVVFIMVLSLLPQHVGPTVSIFHDRNTDTQYYFKSVYGKGYPFVYYIPSGSDYGANFMLKPFIINLLIILIISWSMLFLFKRFFKKS